MNMNEKLREYARLTVKMGVNVSHDQEVFLTCPVECAAFGRMIMEEAYAAGAREVIMNYVDAKAQRIKYLNSDISIFETVPSWDVEKRTHYGRRKGAMISILAEDPDINCGVPGEKLMAATRARHEAFKEYYKLMDAGDIRWTLVAYPIPEWATKVFPDLTPDEAVDKLWDAIFETVRISDGADSVALWFEHDKNLKSRSKIMNDLAFDSIICKNSLGTTFQSVFLRDISGAEEVIFPQTDTSTSLTCQLRSYLLCPTAAVPTVLFTPLCPCHTREI